MGLLSMVYSLWSINKRRCKGYSCPAPTILIMDKTIIRKNFSKGAATYDLYAAVQKACGEKLAETLPEKGIRNILEIGCGTGIYTSLLREKYPHAKITAVDISGGMLSVARENLIGRNIDLLETDAENLDFRERFDLITSNASLHWFSDIKKALDRFSCMLSDNGALCFTIYGPLTFWELNEVLSKKFGQKKWLHAATFPDNEALGSMLSSYFASRNIKEEFFTEESPSLLDFMKAVKLTGTRGKGLASKIFLGKDRVKVLERDFVDIFGTIKVTHHVYFCKAGKTL